jgi:hypothetical protein
MFKNNIKIGLVIALLCLVFVVFPVSVQAADYYVDASLGTNDPSHGTSLGTGAWKTITYALSQVSGSGHTIHVAKGTYNLALGETFPINMKDGVSLKGAGAASTILNAASSNQRVINCIELGNGEMIDGFTITGGFTDEYGGGILIMGDYNAPLWSQPTIKNCSITGNVGFGGGGVAIIDATGISYADEPHFINCTIADNIDTGYSGGGVYSSGHYWGKARFTNCTITNNTSYYYGGGMFADSGNFYLVNTVVKGNNAYNYNGQDFDCYTTGTVVYANGCNFSPDDTYYGYCTLLGANNINVVPGFVGGGDYHITETSAMIDQGRSLCTGLPGTGCSIPTDDIDGDSRVAPPDIGSDEYVERTCVDNDSDGYGLCPDCGISNGCVNDGDDCDDTDPAVNPGETEVCDGVDNNCNDIVDEGGDSLCDDSLWCNGQETCGGESGCMAGTAPDCSSLADSCNDSVCDEETKQCVADPKPDGTSCDDGLFCTINEVCTAGECSGGTARDCSANNIAKIETCANNPDNNPSTWDFLPGFTSVCDEEGDACTSGTIELTHTCSVVDCSAACDDTHTCADTECNSLDGCVNGTYRDYHNVANTCQADCSCTNNECTTYDEIVTDSDGDGFDIECDNDCDDSDASINPGAKEICNGKDDDCDGEIDEGDRDGDGIPDCADSCPDEDATGLDANGDGCIDTIGGLAQLVQTLVAEGIIDEQLQNSLLSKVKNAEKSADKENICAAVNQLQAFKNEVNAQRGKKISNEAANLVIAYANNVIAGLLSQLPPGESC